MSFSTDWDIEKYRVGYESEEHWELRKKFLVKHKNKYPEDKLVCLTQVFYNVEFLGCRYPKATMKMVESLSEGIVEDHREKMKGRLKRTFVEASDAASSKVKGLKRSAAASTLVPDDKIDEANILPTRTRNKQPVPQVSTDNQLTEQPTPAKKKKKKKKSVLRSTPSDQPSEISASAISTLLESPDFQNLVLYFGESETFKQKFLSSCVYSGISHEMSYEFQEKSGDYRCSVKVFNVPIAVGCGTTAVLAGEAAAKTAITFLSQHCYTILVNNRYTGERIIERHEVIDCEPSQSSEAEVVSNDKASRMMKMMGWSGGGLGKEEQGRTEPVMPVHQRRRPKFGSADESTAKPEVKYNILRKILQKFAKTASTDELVFSTDFSLLERKEIHEVATRLNLKNKSRSKGDARHLVVSRKWTAKALLSFLKDPKNKSEKYQLIPPNSEAVTVERKRHRIEEKHLRDLEKETAEIASKEKKARTDQGVACQQYDIQLQELKKEMDEYRLTAAVAEVNCDLLAAVRDEVAKKELEMEELRQAKRKCQAESGCALAVVNSTLANQISVDMKQITKRVEDAQWEMKELSAKGAKASKIISNLRAYTLTAKKSRLDWKCRLKAMYVEHSKERKVASFASSQAQARLCQVAPTRKQTTRLAVLKELQEEKFRGENLTKDLSEMTQRAAAMAAKREQWLKTQFSKDDQTAG